MSWPQNKLSRHSCTESTPKLISAGLPLPVGGEGEEKGWMQGGEEGKEGGSRGGGGKRERKAGVRRGKRKLEECGGWGCKERKRVTQIVYYDNESCVGPVKYHYRQVSLRWVAEVLYVHIRTGHKYIQVWCCVQHGTILCRQWTVFNHIGILQVLNFVKDKACALCMYQIFTHQYVHTQPPTLTLPHIPSHILSIFTQPVYLGSVMVYHTKMSKCSELTEGF